MRNLYTLDKEYIEETLNSWCVNYGTIRDEHESAEDTTVLEVILDMFEDGNPDYTFRKWHEDDIVTLTNVIADLVRKQLANHWRSESMISALQYDEGIKATIGQMLSDLYMNDSTIAVETFISQLYETCRIFISALREGR